MCYATPRPTPSEVGELRLVHPLSAGIVPCIDPLPCILSSESFLVVHLAPMCGTRFRCVAIFNVESTCETHVPIRVHLHNVRMWRVWRLGSLTVKSSYLWRVSYSWRCHSPTSSCHMRVLHMVCKRCACSASSSTTTTTSTSTSSSSSASPISTIIPCAGIVTGSRLSSERGNVQLLDGGTWKFAAAWGGGTGALLNDIAAIWVIMDC
jgi:hypothetical protein